MLVNGFHYSGITFSNWLDVFVDNRIVWFFAECGLKLSISSNLTLLSYWSGIMSGFMVSKVHIWWSDPVYENFFSMPLDAA